jgi:hypothetical protein
MSIQEDTRQKTRRPSEVVPCKTAHEIFEAFMHHGSSQRAADLRNLARQLCGELRRNGKDVSDEVEAGVYRLLREAVARSKNEYGHRITFKCDGSCAALYTPVPQT